MNRRLRKKFAARVGQGLLLSLAADPRWRDCLAGAQPGDRFPLSTRHGRAALRWTVGAESTGEDGTLLVDLRSADAPALAWRTYAAA